MKERRKQTIKAAFDRLRDSDEIVLAAVSESGRALQWASDRLRDSLGVVLTAVTAVSQDDYAVALSFASDRLRDCDVVVSAAVSANPGAWMFASVRLQEERFVKEPAQDTAPDG